MLTNLRYISPWHFYDYAAHLAAHGLNYSELRAELLVIRLFHSKIRGAKYLLPDSTTLRSVWRGAPLPMDRAPGAPRETQARSGCPAI